MLKNKLTLLILVLLIFNLCARSQGGSGAVANQLPDFIPAAPEAANLFKAEQLGVGLTTGSPNVAIPLYTLDYHGYSLPVTLSYNSTGIKVDEYASMVGLGWVLQYGGVVSRTVLDKPDEYRDADNNNLTTPNPNVMNDAAYTFLNSAPDKQSDIFSFSFPGFSGKFVLDEDLLPKQLSNQNLKIQVIGGSFLNGFIISDDKGYAFHFEEKEISTTRNPTGTNCTKNYEVNSIPTSWYLTKIVFPSTRKYILFEYNSAEQTFESSISQTISKVLSTEVYRCTNNEAETGPKGDACVVNSETFSTCVSRQTLTAKFISLIQTSDGDKIRFNYHATSREDMNGGKRLINISVKNRTGKSIRYIEFDNTYYGTVSGNGESVTTHQTKRLFLTGLTIRPSETFTSYERMVYSFDYYSPTSLPKRLSYAQDEHGYYNGKNTNASLIPILSGSDNNYSTFSSGTGSVSIAFGDRSIDTVHGIKGLLMKVQYPTKGYDIIEYGANKTLKTVGGTPVEVLTGGFSVSAIKSYTDDGGLARERRFYYRDLENHLPTSFVFTNDLVFSQQSTLKRDSYVCSGVPGVAGAIYYEGPACTYATVTSNANHPIQDFSGQHLYYRAALEIDVEGGVDQGATLHKYSYFAGGLIGSNHIMGNYNLGTPFQVVPEFYNGETETTVFKRSAGSLVPVKKIVRDLDIYNLTEITNYVVKKVYEYGTTFSPPTLPMFDPFDVDRYYINFYTVRNMETTEITYNDNGVEQTTVAEYVWENLSHNYPTSVITTDSKGNELKTDYKYPQDYVSGYTALINRNMVGSLIEEKKSVASIQQSIKNHIYNDWLTDGTVIKPSETALKLIGYTQSQKVLYHSYDRYGNPLEISEDNGERISFIWDYDSTYPVAKVVNAQQTHIAYTSFESNGKGNWSYIGVPVNDASAPTGKKSYNLTAFTSITKAGLTSGNTYILTYWTKNASAFSITGTVSGYPKAGPVINGWRLFEHKITGRTSVSISGSGFIDELRLYPENALMVTQTYDPLVGMTSQCDANNRVTYYRYDGLGRLLLIQDEFLNVLKKNCYYYSGNLEGCTVYANEEQSQNFSRNNCGTYYAGIALTYKIPAGMFYSTTSQAHANALAAEELALSGQAYANQVGLCYLQCGTPLCVGEDKKCIASVRCETGVKVVTSVVRVHGSLWECTYHYEWSDGSWSPNYTEQTSYNCNVVF